MGDTAMNIPVKVRTHELNQIQRIVPDLISDLHQAELDTAADDMSRIYDAYMADVEATYPEDDFAAYLSMPPEDWRLTMRHLNRARVKEGVLYVSWLQNKLVSRIEDRMDEMMDSEDN